MERTEDYDRYLSEEYRRAYGEVVDAMGGKVGEQCEKIMECVEALERVLKEYQEQVDDWNGLFDELIPLENGIYYLRRGLGWIY